MNESRFHEIAFFGKITASLTHELKNVLAVIKETSGLLGDILELKDLQKFSHKEKFQNAILTIQKQIDHGVTLLNHLNRFAHTSDQELVEIDLYETIKELKILSGRYARLKNIALNVKPPDIYINFTTCQISLQMVLFSCLDYCISNLPQNSQIDISAHQNKEESFCKVDFNCSHDFIDSADISKEKKRINSLEKLEKVVDLINAEILKEPKVIELVLPSKQ